MVIDVGHGPPLVLVPGIQGRWEYLGPAIDCLARSFRVLTFPLCGERGSEVGFDPALGFDNDARRILAILDGRGIDRAAICGVSFGGLPAIRFAAAHPDRASGLVVVSTPGPGWHLKPKHRLYSRAPWLFGPLFLLESPFRLRRELVAAFPDLGQRLRFVGWQLGALARAPVSPSRMAARAALISRVDILADCTRVAAPTLIVTGERELDRVVPVDGTVSYRRHIAGSAHVTIERTGHLGSITRPEAFAAAVRAFVEAGSQPPPPRLRRSAEASGEGGRDPVHNPTDPAYGWTRATA